MFDVTMGGKSSNCQGVTRRDVLRVGGLSALGLTLANFFRAQAIAADTPVANAPGSPNRRAMNSRRRAISPRGCRTP